MFTRMTIEGIKNKIYKITITNIVYTEIEYVSAFYRASLYFLTTFMYAHQLFSCFMSKVSSRLFIPS